MIGCVCIVEVLFSSSYDSQINVLEGVHVDLSTQTAQGGSPCLTQFEDIDKK